MVSGERLHRESSAEVEPGKFPKDLLSIADLSTDQLTYLLHYAINLKALGTYDFPLAGKTVVLFFEKPSLRTKLSLQRAVADLGGTPVVITGQEIQIGSRETVEDIAGVLTRMAHGVVARVNEHRILEQLSQNAPRLPVINALSDREHPLQILADLQTMLEKKARLEGLSVAYVGDGNNVARSLALACAALGMYFRIASPPGFELDQITIRQALGLNSRGERVFTTDIPARAVRNADVVYTDTWISMGQDQEKEVRLQAFRGYQVTSQLMALAKPDAIFMHCMPAHRGQEVQAEVIDGPQSVIFDQAENRLHTAKAVLAALVK